MLHLHRCCGPGLVVLAAVACGLVEGPEPQATRTTPTAEREHAAATRGPPGKLVPPRPGEERFAGVIEDRLGAGSYAYLAVRSGRDLRWVATMGSGRPVGENVVIRSMGLQTDFHSNRLDRTFATLVFGVVEDPASSSAFANPDIRNEQ